jgi:hypothetical protein
MNRDSYDDDLEDLDDEDDILKDGESLRVPIQFLDSTQRAIAQGFDADNHRPGWRLSDSGDARDAAETAYEERNAWMRDAHKTPAAATVSNDTVDKRRPVSLADAQAAARLAYEERNAWMRDAHKQRP